MLPDTWMLVLVAAAIGLELLVPLLARRRPRYGVGHTAATVVCAAGFVGAGALFVTLLGGLFVEVYAQRAFDIPPTWWGFALGILAWDFFYYWRHRLDHTVRWLWASHAPHHSATEINFLTTVRQGWTDLLSAGWLFTLAFVWLGFDPAIIALNVTLQLGFETWIHNDWTPRLGPLEGVFMTPSNHRVHHRADIRYINRNFGRLLILWDRLFGTYAPEDGAENPRYGLLGRGPGNDPLAIVLHEWIAIARDLFRARGPVEALKALVIMPVPATAGAARRPLAKARRSKRRRR